MNIFSNNLLSTVHHLSTRLGPVMTLFDGLLERITPKTTAQACGGYYCSIVCESCCSNCGGDYKSWTYYRYTQFPGCNGANCYVSAGCTYC
jgi:hypothetical protein